MSNIWKKEIKAVIFDIDNTLLATDKFVLENIKKTIKRLNEAVLLNLNIPTDETIKNVQAKNLPFEDIFKELFVGEKDGRAIWEIVLENYRVYANEKIDATIGALETVRKLVANGILVGIVTNRTAKINERLTQADFNPDIFSFVCAPSIPEFRKPHPRAFEEALKQLQVKNIYADQTIMFGDHPDDYYSAFYQNINFVAVLQGQTKREEFLKIGLENNLIIENLNNIEEVLNKVVEIKAYKNSLTNSSALDGRYRTFILPLQHYFSEFAFYKYRVQAEIEHIICLSEFFNGQIIRPLSGEEKKKMRELYEKFSWHEAYEILQYDHLGRNGIGPTEHDTKSVELWIKEKIDKTISFDLIPNIHIFLTSEDVRNLALKLMLSGAVNEILLEKIFEMTDKLRKLASVYLYDPVMGRTHMQPASPTTFGKIFANYLSRFVDGLERLKQIKLTGKVNGAVGNYNAFFVAYPNLDWQNYSKKLCEQIGLEVNLYTDQRGPQNDMVRVFQAMQEIGNVVRDLAIDLSLYSGFKTMYFSKIESHVGSSVMPHKINPWFAEVAEGNIEKANALINGLSNELDVSRLQRDLSDHDWERSYGEMFGYVLIAIEHINIALDLTKPDTEYALEELKNNPQITSEAIQTVLRIYGINDAYDILKKQTRGKNLSLENMIDFVKELPVSVEIKEKILVNLNPQKYLGLAVPLAKGAIEKHDNFKKDNEKKIYLMK